MIQSFWLVLAYAAQAPPVRRPRRSDVMAVSDRIEDAKLLWKHGHREGAFLAALIAVAATSRKRFPDRKANTDREAFERFLEEANSVRLSVEYRGECHPIEHVFYKWFRCQLVHEGELPIDIEFMPDADPAYCRCARVVHLTLFSKCPKAGFTFWSVPSPRRLRTRGCFSLNRRDFDVHGVTSRILRCGSLRPDAAYRRSVGHGSRNTWCSSNGIPRRLLAISRSMESRSPRRRHRSAIRFRLPSRIPPIRGWRSALYYSACRNAADCWRLPTWTGTGQRGSLMLD